MFDKTVSKLTALYLGILVAICLFFSVPIYELSLQELDRGLRHPEISIELPSQELGMTDRLLDNWAQARDNQYYEAKTRIIQRLIIVNSIILFSGGFASYYLAKRTLQPIEEAHAAQSRFTADASHELRTPITVMQTENEVALMNPKLNLKEAKEQLASNIEELKKLTALSEGLLKLASLENNQLNKHKVSPSLIIDEAVERVLPLAAKKQIKISKSVKAKAQIQADAGALTDAVVILLDNAIKYSPSGIKVEASATQNKGVVSFKVADNGVGIKSQDQEHIFERFYRADSSRTKTGANGYGLGLAIAKNIVDAHGGTIAVISKPDKGSSFIIKLPA